MITERVFRVSGEVLIAQDAKRLKQKGAKFTIVGMVEQVGPAYLTVRITSTGGKRFLREYQVVKVPREYIKVLGIPKKPEWHHNE